MQVPVTLKQVQTKSGLRWVISYKNDKEEWVDSMFSQTKQDVKGREYFSSVIDTEKKPYEAPTKQEPNVKEDSIDPNDLPF